MGQNGANEVGMRIVSAVDGDAERQGRGLKAVVSLIDYPASVTACVGGLISRVISARPDGWRARGHPPDVG